MMRVLLLKMLLFLWTFPVFLKKYKSLLPHTIILSTFTKQTIHTMRQREPKVYSWETSNVRNMVNQLRSAVSKVYDDASFENANGTTMNETSRNNTDTMEMLFRR